jgi:hypothetical protein
MLKEAGADQLCKLGVSSSLAAQLAGISVQAIHRAVMRGTLTATKFQPPGAARASISIDLASLRVYIRRNHG